MDAGAIAELTDATRELEANRYALRQAIDRIEAIVVQACRPISGYIPLNPASASDYRLLMVSKVEGTWRLSVSTVTNNHATLESLKVEDQAAALARVPALVSHILKDAGNLVRATRSACDVAGATLQALEAMLGGSDASR